MERAHELITPYLDMEGLIGIYVVGSTTRPYRDALSDYDFEIVVEDQNYTALPDEERHCFVIDEGPPRRVDHEFYFRPWSEFEGLLTSTQDMFHFAYQHAVVLHDPSGRLQAVIQKLAVLPEDVRATRMMVHYLEYRFGTGRANKTFGRGGTLNGRLVVSEAMTALTKLLFLLHRSWPSMRHWATQELGQLGVPDNILAAIEETIAAPRAEALDSLLEEIHRYLERLGETFHQDMQAQIQWAFLTTEGKIAFQTWGAR
jgi:hypothetical protein